MSFFQSPGYFGIEDHTVQSAESFPLRVYYPTEDDLIVGAPLAPGPHPLVVFAHGNREGAQNAHLCPPDRTNDHRRWTHGLGALARSGFVVAAPPMPNQAELGADRLAATVQWMRTQWSGSRTLHHPPVLDPGRIAMAAARGVAARSHLDAAGTARRETTARVHPGNPGAGHPGRPGALGAPTALAAVGHSWGARACALLAARGGVNAVAAIAGSFDDNASVVALRAAGAPTLLMCGTQDSQTFSYLNGLWGPSLATPRYQAAFQGVGHWDWFGRNGAIRACDGTPTRRPDTGHIAGELLAGFLTRHVARVPFEPPHLVNIPLLRPWMQPWYDNGSAIQVRWDAPGESLHPLPPTGQGILGLWTQTPPFGQ